MNNNMTNPAFDIDEFLVNKITLMSYGLNPHPNAKIMKKVHSRIERSIHRRITTDHYIGAGEYGRERLNNFETKIKIYGKEWDYDMVESFEDNIKNKLPRYLVTF